MESGIFLSVVDYFFQNGIDEVQYFSLKKVSNYHPHVRMLNIYRKNGDVKKYLIKVFVDQNEHSDKNLDSILREERVLKKLKNYGFLTKERVIVKEKGNEVIGFPFVVSAALPGRSINNLSKKAVALLADDILEYLYYLHKRTISSSFKKEFYPRSLKKSFEELESEYLLSDIQRAGINFSEKEKDSLERAISSLGEVELFSLCHCDVTLSNIIWDGKDVNMIDWTYSHFSTPAYDLAYFFFWMIKYEFINELEKKMRKVFEMYKEIGFNLSAPFLYYLSQKYIEYGRMMEGDERSHYIKKGKKLLSKAPIYSLEELLKVVKFL